MRRLFPAFFLAVAVTAQTPLPFGEVILQNITSAQITRTWSVTAIFNQGEVADPTHLALKFGDDEVPVFWTEFGPRHPGGTLWYARGDVFRTLQAYEVQVGEWVERTVAPPSFVWEPAALSMWNNLLLYGRYTDPSGTDHLVQLNPYNPSGMVQQGGKFYYRYNVYTGAINWRVWVTYGSGESGFDFKVGVFNDGDGVSFQPPGEISNLNFRFYIFGAHPAVTAIQGFGMIPIDLDEANNYYSMDLPIHTLCDGQGWVFGGHLSPIDLATAYKYAEQMPVGFLDPDTYRSVELPETQLPSRNESWLSQVKADFKNKYTKWHTTTFSPNYAFDNNLYPAGSGDQTPFGMFPYHVRSLLDNADHYALVCGDVHAMRGLSMRATNIFGFEHVDAAVNHPESTYTWWMNIHSTSQKKWGRYYAGWTPTTTPPLYQGWAGEDAEHFGISQMFYQAFLSNDIFTRDRFRERVEMARAWAHSLSIPQGGYFGGGIDVARSEARFIRLVEQGWFLTNEQELLDHMIQRGDKTLAEYKTQTWNGNTGTAPSVDVPYGSFIPRLRPDTCIDIPEPYRCPPVFITWHESLMVGPYLRLYEKAGYSGGLTIATEIFTILLENGFKRVVFNDWLQDWIAEDPVNHQPFSMPTDPEGKVVIMPSKMSAINAGVDAYKWLKVGHPSHDGLIKWAMVPVMDYAQRVSLSNALTPLQQTLRDEALTTFLVQRPGMETDKWVASPYFAVNRLPAGSNPIGQ